MSEEKLRRKKNSKFVMAVKQVSGAKKEENNKYGSHINWNEKATSVDYLRGARQVLLHL